MLNICWFLWISCWIYVDHGCSKGPPTNTKRFDHFPTMAGKWKSMENSDQNDEQYVETCHAKIPSRQDFRMRSRAIYFARTRWISGWWFQSIPLRWSYQVGRKDVWNHQPDTGWRLLTSTTFPFHGNLRSTHFSPSRFFPGQCIAKRVNGIQWSQTEVFRDQDLGSSARLLLDLQ